jgi:D-serine deaminase-like pyridoxal phosphate-dependent protein
MTYERYRAALSDRSLPAAIVDMDALDANIALVREVAGTKPVRIASKSVRHLGLLRYIVAGLGSARIMAFSAREAAFIAREGFTDIMLAYPTANPSDAALLAEANRLARVSVAVDDAKHLEVLGTAALAANVVIPAIIDVDVSWRTFGLHLGVRRSPLHSAADVAAFADRIAHTRGLSFAGVLAYEAQIAGVTDTNPFSRLMNAGKYAMKRAARGPLEAQRQAIAEALTAKGLPAPLFNGGGSGSLRWSIGEPWLSEVTAGSAFLTGHLFDYYRDISFTPALFFALQVARIPAPGFFTCHGGGYVASGEAGKDRLPLPMLPEGLRLIGLEGAGEVQTPVIGNARLQVGDPIFFRHAKAGELAEHFTHYLQLWGDRIEETPTYRGMGHAFL